MERKVRMSDTKKNIPSIAAALQVAFYASYLVPDYKNLSFEERTKKVEEDYFMALKIADVIFQKARHEKLPPDQERIINKYI
jgi:hypothetical protein